MAPNDRSSAAKVRVHVPLVSPTPIHSAQQQVNLGSTLFRSHNALDNAPGPAEPTLSLPQAAAGPSLRPAQRKYSSNRLPVESDGGPLSPPALTNMPPATLDQALAPPRPWTAPSHETPTVHPGRRSHQRVSSESKLLGFAELCAIRDIASPHSYPLDNFKFWDTTIAAAKFPDITKSEDILDIQDGTWEATESLLANTKRTGNFGSLVIHFLIHMRYLHTLDYDTPAPLSAHNALFILTLFLVNTLRLAPAKRVDELINDQRLHSSHYTNFLGRLAQEPDGGVRLQAAAKVLADQRSRGELFLEAVILALARIDITRHPLNYPFYCLAQRCLIELYAPQLSQPTLDPTPADYFLSLTLTKLGHMATELIPRLLANGISPPLPCPPAAGAVYNAYSYLFTSSKAQQLTNAQALARIGILLALLLMYQAAPSLPLTRPTARVTESNGGGPPSGPEPPRTFASVLARDWGTAVAPAGRQPHGGTSAFPYRTALSVLFKNLQNEVNVLLLHTLLMKSPPFANFVLAQTDPDAFMVPLLKTLLQGVEAPQPNYPRFYLWLGILAQLTADSAFNAELHRQVLENQPWMADRSFRTITLSQLTVLVVIRIIQANFATHKDAFIHQCSLAILINFSAHMAHLPASLVQRLMKIFDMVARRYLKITAVWQDSASPNHQQLSNALHAADFHLYLDMLQVFIFVFSNTLHHHLRQNAHLIYSLLQSKEVFSTLQSDPQVGDAVNNINFVIAYFQACIGEAKLTSPSTEEVLQVIEDKSPLFRTAELPLTPWRAGFRVAAPNLEFYTPYIWQLIVKHSPLSYSLEEAVLVNAFDNEIG